VYNKLHKTDKLSTKNKYETERFKVKKVFSLLLVLCTILLLSACGGNNNDDPNPITCNPGFTLVGDECVEDEVDGNAPVINGVTDAEITVGDAFDPLTGVTASDTEDGDLTSTIVTSGTVDTSTIGIYTVVYTVTDSDSESTQVTRTITVVGLDGCAVFFELVDGECVRIPPTVITIMHGAVYEIDPFHVDYSGTEQLTRQELQRATEAKYNVVINYENYPASAAWGPSRVSSIIQASVAGEPLSDIYWVTSDWLQELVTGNAIAEVTPYMNTIGVNIPDAYNDIGEYQGKVYGFESYRPTIDGGLYYNADLIASLGVTNPTDMYLDGDWNWTNFEAWATQVQTALDGETEDMYALGGMMSYYAEAMTTLNGGSLINKNTGRVSFAQTAALETYDFLTTLFNKNLFEPSPQYDAGSSLWLSGKVAMHPGSLWFVTADNRWGQIEFELGFVPYPVADDYDDEYQTPISGVALMTIASGMTPEKEELVFKVWNELQIWRTDQEAADAFELTLLTKFDEQKYIDAYIDIYDKVYLDILNAMGISAYGENGWARNINIAIRDGSSRTAVETIKPIYETALDDYLGD
jgi:maltose-binding protein MalE